MSDRMHPTDDAITAAIRSRSSAADGRLLADILGAIATTPQQRGLFGWRLRPAPRLLLIGLILLLAVSAAAVAGARLVLPHPAPIRNGEIVAEVDGRLVWIDPQTGSSRDFGCSDCRLPSWSKDGSKLAYVSGPGGVVLRNVDTGEERQVAKCDGSCSSLALSLDGTRVAYAAGQHAHAVDVESGQTWTLAPILIDDVSWSPAGDELLLGGSGFVHRVRLDGTRDDLIIRRDRPMPGMPIGDEVPLAAWAPDGDRIAVVTDPMSTRRSGTFDYQLWVMDPDGGNRRLVWVGPECCVSAWGGPAWSPDGREIAVVATAGGGGGWSVWIVDVDGSNVRKLASVSPERVAWAPGR